MYLAIGLPGPRPPLRINPKQIRVEYVLPKNPAHQPIYERLKQARALERIQTVAKPASTSASIGFSRLSGCDGDSNAWYDGGFVTVCYEYLADILKSAPEASSAERHLTQEDAILGPFMDVFLHEAGHAVFDQLKVPVLGREEDAADLFSAYIMLHSRGGCPQADLGLCLSIQRRCCEPTGALTKYADEHGIPGAAFFNVCIAYGADQKLFADVVRRIPAKTRAEGCDLEYEQLLSRSKKLIGPYIDQNLRKRFSLLDAGREGPAQKSACAR